MKLAEGQAGSGKLGQLPDYLKSIKGLFCVALFRAHLSIHEKTVFIGTRCVHAVDGCHPSLASNPVASSSANAAHRVNGVPFNRARAWPDRLVVRVLPEYRDLCSSTGIADPKFREAVQHLQAASVQRKYPQLRQPSVAVNRYGRKPIDMSLVYEVRFNPSFTLSEAISRSCRPVSLAYAEPLYLHELDYTPNDPDITSQYHISKIRRLLPGIFRKVTPTSVLASLTAERIGTILIWKTTSSTIMPDPIDGIDNDADGLHRQLPWMGCQRE